MKKELLIIGGVFLLIFIVVFSSNGVTIKIPDEDECDLIQTWNIEEYEVRELNCKKKRVFEKQQYHLYKSYQLLSKRGYIDSSDSCRISFLTEPGNHIEADVCTKEFKELKSKKQQVITSKIDSAHMSLHPSWKKYIGAKRMTEDQIDFLAKEWRKATPGYYEGSDHSRPRAYQYQILLFEKDKKRELYIFLDKISEFGEWNYYLEKGRVFDPVWEELAK